MEKFGRKIKFKNKGIYIAVIILLFFLTVSECQQFNRRRSFNPRQRVVNYRYRTQRRPDRAGTGARDSSLGNRQIRTQGRQNTNYVNRRLPRLRDRLDYLEQQGRQQNTVVQGRRPARTNSVSDNRSGTGNYVGVQNGGRRNSANVNIVQTHNSPVPTVRNRNLDNRRDFNFQNAQVIGRNRDGQNIRTYAGSNIQNSNRGRHRFVRPRAQTFNRQRHQISTSRTSRNNFSPNLHRQNKLGHVLQQVQTSTQRLILPHFKPLAPSILRQFHVQHDAPSTPLARTIQSILRHTSTGRIPALPAQPTAQSFPERILQNNDRSANHLYRQVNDGNTLVAPTKTAPVSPTEVTVVNSKDSGQVKQKIQVLVPFPSVVPQRGTSSGSTQVVSRSASSNGNVVLQVAPVAPHVAPPVAPTVVSVVPVGALPSQRTQNLGLPLSTGNVHSGVISGNAVPIQNTNLANTIHRSVPVYSWMNHLLYGGEQPDSPDPTDAAKTVTELVSLLTSTTKGGHTATEEEEEIEWEDMPPTTTTATFTTPPLPTTQAPTTPAPSVIKSIAQRIVALLLQKGKTGISQELPAVPDGSQHTVSLVQPTSVADVNTAGTTNPHDVSLAILQGNRFVNSDPVSVPAENLIKTAQISTKRENSVTNNAPSVFENSLQTEFSPKLTSNTKAPQHTQDVNMGITATKLVPDLSRSIPSETGNILNLNDVIMSDTVPNDVIMSDTLPTTRNDNSINGVILTQYMSSNDLGGLSVKKIVAPAAEQASHGANQVSAGSENIVSSNQGTAGNTAALDILSKLKAIMNSQNNPTVSTAVVSSVPIARKIPPSDLNGLLADPPGQQIGLQQTNTKPLHPTIAVRSNNAAANGKTAVDLLASLKSLLSAKMNNVVDSHIDNSRIDKVSISPYVSKNNLGGLSVQKIFNPSQTAGTQEAKSISADFGIPVRLNPDDPMVDMDLVAKIPVDPKDAQAARKIDVISLSPYLSSNDLGGLTATKLSSPSKEPGMQGTNESGSFADFGNTHASKQSARSNTVAMDLLAKIKLLVDSQGNPTTTTPPPMTTLPTASSVQKVASPPTETCTPMSPNFRCKGKDLFLTMESISAWCLGMCVRKGCVHTVCKCGCDIPVSNPSPSAQSITASQRRMLGVFGLPLTRMTTEEPPEEEEWEAEDGTTTKAPSSTENPWWAEQWQFRGTSPSPQKDFSLNPIDKHSSHMKNIDQHVSEIQDVAWATELKSRLSKLAANAGNSANSPNTDSSSGGKAPPSWQGTQWHLPTPSPPKKPENSERFSGSQSFSSPWQPRPLRDKWGSSERFIGNGASANSESGNSWNNWNMTPMNPWGNGIGEGFDRRLSRFRFNFGKGSGSGGAEAGAEEQEANDKR